MAPYRSRSPTTYKSDLIYLQASPWERSWCTQSARSVGEVSPLSSSRRSRKERVEGDEGLQRKYAVAEHRVLLVESEVVQGVGDPACGEPHEPLHELRRGSRAFLLVQDRGGGGGSAGDVLPSGDCVGVSPPAVKMSSMRANSVSDSFQLAGEPIGPFRARSITWCDRAIVPRRARTWSRVSPPREESVASGVRNSAFAVGGDEDAEPVMWCAGQ